MGKFSWCTSDTRKSIPSVIDAYEGAPGTVYLLNPFGKPYREDDYKGYGEFGSRDVFELVAEWNREYLSSAILEKPKIPEGFYGEGVGAVHEMKLARYNALCAAIEDYAHGATDEQMETRHRAIFDVTLGPDWKRCLGIALTSSEERHVKLKYPIKIVEKPCAYDKAGISPDCPRQGCIYDASLNDIQKSVDKAFEKLAVAKEKYTGEKIDALCDFFWKSHMEDVTVTEDKRGHLVAKDSEGNRWRDAEIYDFVLNECLGFEPDGTLQFGFGAISQELADTLKAHAAAYGVLVNTPATASKQYTLEYLNDAGDVIARDYFRTDDEAKQFATALLEVYREEGSESVRGLCITDELGVTVWEAEVDSAATSELLPDDEVVKLWMDDLLEKSGKSSLDELTPEEISAEIEEVKGTLRNESVWALADVANGPDNTHAENVATLEAYLTELNDLLDSRAKTQVISTGQEGRKTSLADKIAEAEKVSQSTRQEAGEIKERDNGGNFNERDSYN